MRNSFTMHDLPAAERPRERLQKFGIEALSAAELLALILGRGIAGEPVAMTAQRLLSQFGSVKGIAEASVEELTGVRGVGLAKAAQIKAAFELANRLDSHLESESKPLVKTPEEVDRLLSASLRGKKREHFIVLLLDTRSRLIKSVTVSVGSMDTSIADPRNVFKEAIAGGAASVIFVHNHPSGDPRPSQDDIWLTKRLAEVGKTTGIDVLDHVIIGKAKKENGKDKEKGYFSLKREGLF